MEVVISMATKEISNFYFFKSKTVLGKEVPKPKKGTTNLYLVGCLDCKNKFALRGRGKAYLARSGDAKSVPEITKDELVGNDIYARIKICPRCKSEDHYATLRKYTGTVQGKERLERAIKKLNEELDFGAFHFLNTREIEKVVTHQTKYESLVESWLLIGTANLPVPEKNGEPDFPKFHSFLGKNNVYPVNQSPGQSYFPRNIKGEYCGFYFIGSEARFGTKGPYLILKRRTGPGNYIYYKGRLNLSDSKEEVLAHVDGVGIKEDDVSHRERIPDDTQIFIWNRDGGACVKCGSRENLAFDHIIPYSLGGSNSRRNLQLLCDSCNSKKGSKIGG